MTLDDLDTILRRFSDPDAPERTVARAMLHGRATSDLRATARDLATALRLGRMDAVSWASAAFVNAGEEAGLVPVEREPVGTRLYQ